MAAFMAVAHAKFTGELGVCLSSGGPGATHLITGLYDGKLDHTPVLAIAGQAESSVRGASYQQEINLDRMFCLGKSGAHATASTRRRTGDTRPPSWRSTPHLER
jgi:glyoxylate carboligase